MAAADPQPEPAPKKDAAPAEKPGETVNALFEAAAEQYANRAAMRCVLDATKTYTYAEYAKEARRLAKGLVALLREGAGDAPHETAAPAASVSAGSRPYVAVYMANGPQYLVAFMGAVLAGYVPAQVEPVVRQARARLVLVDEWTERHQRLSTVFGARAVFVMCAPVDQKCPAVPLAAVHARGDAVPDGVLASVAAAATPDAPCEVVLSLQEDGTDRLVVLSHRSVVAVARALVALVTQRRTPDARLRGWVPDHEAPACMACRAPFTALRRRHHCRKCEGVFCSACCHWKRPLLSKGFPDAVRVCFRCYSELGGDSAPASAPQSRRQPHR